MGAAFEVDRSLGQTLLSATMLQWLGPRIGWNLAERLWVGFVLAGLLLAVAWYVRRSGATSTGLVPLLLAWLPLSLVTAWGFYDFLLGAAVLLEAPHADVARAVLDAAVDQGEERVRDVLEQQADACGLPTAQQARSLMGAVAQFIDRRAHPFHHRLADSRFAVDDSRDRLEAHAGQTGDVVHRRTAAGAPTSSLGHRQRLPYGRRV